MVDKLKNFLVKLKALRKDIKAEKVKRIAKKDLRDRAEQLGIQWFRELNNHIAQQFDIRQDILEKYSEGFNKLIALSSSNKSKNIYLEVLDSLTKPFQSELILTAQKGSSSTVSLNLLHKILGNLPDQGENEYLAEAIGCAQRGFFRAAVVLGWCATIDRIHKRIEDVGFIKFNMTSAQMTNQKKGRFKRFNSLQNINSLSELREVFDTVVLWIIEGIGMIDSNQHTRLKSCFDMRCQCAHPGEAPVTEYNLMSFFSDINEIVFQNPMFNV